MAPLKHGYLEPVPGRGISFETDACWVFLLGNGRVSMGNVERDVCETLNSMCSCGLCFFPPFLSPSLLLSLSPSSSSSSLLYVFPSFPLSLPPPPSVLCGAFTWLLERTQTLRSSHQVPGEHSWVPGSIVSVLSEYLLQLLRSTLLALQKFSFSL